MELFDENNNRKYSQQTLINAYENMEWTNNEGEFNFPDGDFFYMVFESAKEDAEQLVKDLFLDIYLIDSFFQQDSDEFYIAGFIFRNNVVIINYWAKKVNAESSVEIYKDGGKWYCTGFGAIKYVHPVCVNDFPNGYPHSYFKTELVSDGYYKYLKILN